jgi:hypothetical protein
MIDQPDDESLDWYDSLFLGTLHVAQGICPNRVDVGWATHVVVDFATAAVQKANPMRQGPLSSVPTRNILYYSIFVHARCCQPHAHAQTTLAFVPNKIRQT